ncbi:MAG: hypothetical protein K9K32_01745, partial [Halanaerobiales bacterium]|nr:hypothetical protein [Halanaerobiales bacterium]
MNSSIISDQYILINRFYWLAISIFLFVLSTKIYDKYRNGKRIHLIFFKNKDKKTSNIKNIRLKNKLFSEMIYSIKIYSGWRILIGLLVSIILALIYSRLVQRQYRVFLYLGTGEIFLSLLGILGTLGINNIEKEKRTIKYIGSLPFNEKRLLRQKLFVSFIYFLAVYLSYTLFGMIFIGTFITKMTLIFIPSYLFFSVLVLILSKMFKSTLLGGIFIGFIWFLPIVAGRKFPYWIHPFYYFAEFDHYYNNFLLKNKIILLVITMILIISFLLVKKVKISKE